MTCHMRLVDRARRREGISPDFPKTQVYLYFECTCSFPSSECVRRSAANRGVALGKRHDRKLNMDSPNEASPSSSPEQPITERSNSKSENIDTATAKEIIDILHVCEEEIFTGWHHYQTLYDKDFVRKLCEVSKYAARLILDAANSAIILSGCGTSGRIAFFIATKMNYLLEEKGLPQCFHYIIAGGNKALTHSVEAFEDSPQAGKEELIKVCQGQKKILFIGISCGISAPFIAGQLDYCMSDLDTFLPILLGFNPSHMVKDRTIEGWEHTVLSVTKRLMHLESSGQGYVLNPVVGPEAITGSSRMKGGGATKLILETCFLTALSSPWFSSESTGSDKMNANQGTAQDSSKQGKLITGLLECYKQVRETSYETSKEELSKLIEQAGKSLLASGHVYYIGWDTWGILGLIDSSECPPTFGSDFDDIRGFLKGGLVPLAFVSHAMNAAVVDNLLKDETSLEFFKKYILPSLTSEDTVIFLLPSNERSHEVGTLLQSVMEKTQQVGTISLAPVDGTQLDQQNCTMVHLEHLHQELMAQVQDEGLDSRLENAVMKSVVEFALKSSLNAISTGAHIMKGKVYQNYMVDLRLSNSKLLERGVGIVAKCAGCSTPVARDAVMRAIYRTDDITELRSTPVSSIIQTAGNVERVVPIAIILAIKGCTVKEAMDHQERVPIIRTSLVDLLQQ